MEYNVRIRHQNQNDSHNEFQKMDQFCCRFCLHQDQEDSFMVKRKKKIINHTNTQLTIILTVSEPLIESRSI